MLLFCFLSFVREKKLENRNNLLFLISAENFFSTEFDFDFRFAPSSHPEKTHMITQSGCEMEFSCQRISNSSDAPIKKSRFFAGPTSNKKVAS